MPPFTRGIRIAMLVGATAALVLMTSPSVRADGVYAAPDVVVLCEPTLTAALTQIGQLWRQKTGIDVRIFASPTRLLIEQVAHRPRSDLLVAQGEEAGAAAEQRQVIKPGSRYPLGRSHLVLAVRAGTQALPADAASLRNRPIALVDTEVDPVGDESRTALKAAGLWDAVGDHVVGVTGTPDAAFLLKAQTVKLAVLYASDVAADATLRLGSKLPDGDAAPETYWVAQTANMLSANTAAFADFLRGPEAKQILRADGLGVPE